MTTQNTSKNLVSCPNCHVKIKKLCYISHQSISGEFTLATGHEDNLEADQDSIEYSCPECDTALFGDEQSAEDFLLGKKVRPKLLKRTTTKPLKGAK